VVWSITHYPLFHYILYKIVKTNTAYAESSFFW